MVFMWRGKIYVDTRPCFGVASGPALFDEAGKFLQWICEQKTGINFLRLLDDNLGVVPFGEREAEVALRITLDVCESLGVPMAEEKLTAPARIFVFLGLLWNLVEGHVSLPHDKWVRMMAELAQTVKIAKATGSIRFKMLESLTGYLSWTAQVIRHARPYPSTFL